MDKRFTDTEKWNDPWFCGLSVELKLLWLFLVDSCDVAGVWKVNKKYAEFVIGAPINWEEAGKVFNGRVIIPEKSGEYWFLPKYLYFHYPHGLSWDSNFTKGVIMRLSQRKLLKIVIERFGKSFVRVDQDLIKSTPTPQNKNNIISSKYIDVFNELWTQYPKKIDKSKALGHFTASVKTDEDAIAIRKALVNYLQYIEEEVTNEKYIKHAKTWFNNWKDWVEWKSEKPQRRML
jgi:hypothetical protein